MKRNFILSCLLALIILVYGVMVNIVPARVQWQELQQQNQQLSLKVKRAKQNVYQAKGLASDAFYAWFSRQPFSAVKLMVLSGNNKTIHVQLAGSSDEILQLLAFLQESQLGNLTLSKTPEGLSANIDFNAIIAQEVPLKAVMVKPSPQNAVKVLGVMQKNGQRFCVVEAQGKIIFKQESVC